jgi:hypothetical protein
MTGIVYDFPQRSTEWQQIRLGRLCGSRAAEMLAEGKKGTPSASRRNLCMQLALERITGCIQERGFLSPAMLAGIEREAMARDTYQLVTGQQVAQAGYVAHPTLMAGFSPDGYVGDWLGLCEFKSPLAATHYEALETSKVPTAHQKQIMHALWISGAQWCDWMSYEPTFPEKLRAKIIRVERDEEAIAEYEEEVKKFLAEVEERVEFLKGLEAA